MNKLADACQCCAQKKDAARPEGKRRCCAAGKCCRRPLSKRSVNDARTVLRSALGNAVVEERVSKILRHSEIAVTMEVYTHVPSAETRKALRKLGKLLGGSKQG